jgi:hypothetical protein
MRGSLRSTRQRLARLGVRVEGLVGTRRGALVLFLLALIVFAVEGIGWRVGAGRDLGTYLRYYLMMWESDPLFPQAILARTPVAPVVAGVLLDGGGRWLVEIAMAMLFAGSIVAWSAAAVVAGRRVAIATAFALLLYPSYGALFRGLSTDALFAAGFAGWALLASRAARRPSPATFAVLGAGVAGLTLIRPSSQALLVAVVLPLVVAGSWRRRAAGGAAFVAAAALGLLAWAAVNELRYDDFTVARGTQAVVPLFRAFATDRIVEPANGPASGELADAVRRDLLPREPYRSYGIDLDEFFGSGSGRMHEDLIGLSDRVFGWDSDYELLGRVGREAVLSHPGTYVRGVARSLWQELHHPLLLPLGESADSGDGAAPGGEGETIVVDGRRLPKPSEGQPIPAAHQSGFVSRPDGSAREVWTSPTEHHVAFADPRDAPRYETLERRLDELLGRLPSRPASGWLHERLNEAARVYPRSWLWLLVGIFALLVRRPAAWRLPVVVAGSGLVVLLVTVLGVYAVPEYAVPVAPAFVLLACTGLFGPKSPPNASRTKAGATGSR